MLEFLQSPGAVIGCIVGIGLASALQWLFPEQNMLFAQALIVVGGGVAGVLIEHNASRGKSRE